MQKRASKNAGAEIIVTIAKFGEEPQNVKLTTGASVADALKASGLSLTGREQTFVEGETATGEDILENGDILSIVTPKQAGNY